MAAGTLYRFRLDGKGPCPDPASRFQPEGPDGPRKCRSARLRLDRRRWPGVQLAGQVIYEMHVGTFTPEGTWQAAARQLPELAELGITLLEMMPVADWPGDFGWGYDGVEPVCAHAAVRHARRFPRVSSIGRIAVGIGVMLDVVYNHFGGSGCYLGQFSPTYFTDRYENEWGRRSISTAPTAAPVREFFLANARYWIEEFHLDGYRIDATQAFFDGSPEHILAEITRDGPTRRPASARSARRRERAAGTRMVRPARRRAASAWTRSGTTTSITAAMVRLTGRNEAYYTDYLGTADEFVALVKWGFLYQGQRYKWQKKRRGTPAFDLPPATFVNYLAKSRPGGQHGLGLRMRPADQPGRGCGR